MMCTNDEMEKMLPSPKEEEEEEEEETEEEEGDDEEGDDIDEDGSEKDGEEEASEKNKGDEKDEALPRATKKKSPFPVKAKEKKQDGVLNLNNEVVRMRKEVKRVRALIFRKLTRQIAALKKKKGKEAEMERNQRRAARLLEEIHAMKVLVPDVVTKTALQKNLNFEQVCKNPKSTIADRATARIATHPQFSKKIESINAAVKAFKEQRMMGGKQAGAEKVQNQAGKAALQLQDKRVERKSEKKEEDHTAEVKEIPDGEEGVGSLENTEDATVTEVEKEVEKETCSAGPPEVQVQEMSVKSSDVKHDLKNKPQSKPAVKKPSLVPAPAAPQKTSDGDESDLELSDDEEKQYFDDSTEERFHKQSSQSESDDDDDFFVGKVSKFKKKKKQQQKDTEGEERPEVKKDSTDSVKTSDKLQNELDELESRLKSKATALQSVFCSSLAATKTGRGGSAGRGRGGDKFRGQGKPKDGSSLNRDFSKQSKFQKPNKGVERNSGSKYSKPGPEGRFSESEEKGFASAGRGRGRGRGGDLRQKDHRGGGAFSHPASQQALHPSWEASKKRKEQQGQILAFQGKKIKFDDD